MVALLNSTPTFEWHLARRVVKNRDYKDPCYDEIGLCAQQLDTTLRLIVRHHNWEGLCDGSNKRVKLGGSMVTPVLEWCVFRCGY